MKVDLLEDYPGELTGRPVDEIAASIAASVEFAKGGAAVGYRSPADFTAAALWDVHARMSSVGRAHLSALAAAVDAVVVREVGT